MPQPHLHAHKIRMLFLYCAAENFNKIKAANQLGIARSTATKYISAFRQSGLTISEIEHARPGKLHMLLFPNCKHPQSNKKDLLIGRLAFIHSRIETMVSRFSMHGVRIWRQIRALTNIRSLLFFMLFGERNMD